MSKQIEIRCDSCGALKRSENHWWRLSISEGVLQIVPEWFPVEPEAKDLFLCGETCVAKKVSEWMSAQAR